MIFVQRATWSGCSPDQQYSSLIAYSQPTDTMKLNGTIQFETQPTVENLHVQQLQN